MGTVVRAELWRRHGLEAARYDAHRAVQPEGDKAEGARRARGMQAHS